MSVNVAAFQSSLLSLNVAEDPDVQYNLYLSWNDFTEDSDPLNIV